MTICQICSREGKVIDFELYPFIFSWICGSRSCRIQARTNFNEAYPDFEDPWGFKISGSRGRSYTVKRDRSNPNVFPEDRVDDLPKEPGWLKARLASVDQAAIAEPLDELSEDPELANMQRSLFT